jgi:hypothetical protein
MDLDPEARRLLSLVQAARTPSDEDKARVEKQLALALGTAALAAPTAAAAKAVTGTGALKASSGLLTLKWFVGGSALLAAAVGGYVALSEPAPVATSRGDRPHAAVPAQDLEVAASPAPAAPVVTPALEPPATVVPAAASDETDAAPAGSPARKKRKIAPQESDRLAAELTLLHRAQSAWRAGDARGALSLVREHDQRFPRSELALERDTLEVLALCELGQKQAATRLAKRLLARAPSSPLRASIEESCALR